MTNDIMQKIIDLEREIAALPSGSVSKKTIKDKVYYYHRVTRDGKVKETYVRQYESELPVLHVEKIESAQKPDDELVYFY